MKGGEIQRSYAWLESSVLEMKGSRIRDLFEEQLQIYNEEKWELEAEDTIKALDFWEKYSLKFNEFWDREVMNKIQDHLVVKVRERCSKSSGLTNMSTEYIDESIVEILDGGKKSVPTLLGSFGTEVEIFKGSILTYLAKYRRMIQRMPKIATTDVKVWLKEALEEYDEHGVEKDTYYYYYQRVKTELGFVLKTIRKRLARADKEQKLTLKSVFVEGVDEVVKSVFSEADKNYGTVLIECKDIAEAEKRVLRELGGHRVDLNVDEALDAIDKKLLEFEVN